jgi:hypothetical protein
LTVDINVTFATTEDNDISLKNTENEKHYNDLKKAGHLLSDSIKKQETANFYTLPTITKKGFLEWQIMYFNASYQLIFQYCESKNSEASELSKRLMDKIIFIRNNNMWLIERLDTKDDIEEIKNNIELNNFTIKSINQDIDKFIANSDKNHLTN